MSDYRLTDSEKEWATAHGILYDDDDILIDIWGVDIDDLED